MSPEEIEILSGLGLVLYSDQITSAAYAFTWGIHLLLMIAAFRSLLHHGLKTAASKFLCVLLIVLAAINSFSVIGTIKTRGDRLRDGFTANPDLSLDERWFVAEDRVRASDLYHALVFVRNQPGLMVIIGDVVIVWRAWLIWMGRKLWMVIPIFLIFAATAMGLYSSSIVTAEIISSTAPLAIVSTAATACSIAANAITTFMVGLQAYRHRKVMKEVSRNNSSPSLRILMFLTEGGLVYLVIQIITFALTLSDPSTDLDIAWMIFINLNNFVSITSPAIVILMASHNRSLANDSGITGVLTNLESHISFGTDSRRAAMSDFGTLAASPASESGAYMLGEKDSSTPSNVRPVDV